VIYTVFALVHPKDPFAKSIPAKESIMGYAPTTTAVYGIVISHEEALAIDERVHDMAMATGKSLPREPASEPRSDEPDNRPLLFHVGSILASMAFEFFATKTPQAPPAPNPYGTYEDDLCALELYESLAIMAPGADSRIHDCHWIKPRLGEFGTYVFGIKVASDGYGGSAPTAKIVAKGAPAKIAKEWDAKVAPILGPLRIRRKPKMLTVAQTH
jgi:hypothetical protein